MEFDWSQIAAATLHLLVRMGNGDERRIPPLAPGQDWRIWLILFGRRFRQSLLSHHIEIELEEAYFHSLKEKLEVLCDAGFSQEDALRMTALVGHYTLGCGKDEQAASAEDFEFGLLALVEGFNSYLKRHRIE